MTWPYNTLVSNVHVDSLTRYMFNSCTWSRAHKLTNAYLSRVFSLIDCYITKILKLISVSKIFQKKNAVIKKKKKVGTTQV